MTTAKRIESLIMGAGEVDMDRWSKIYEKLAMEGLVFDVTQHVPESIDELEAVRRLGVKDLRKYRETRKILLYNPVEMIEFED